MQYINSVIQISVEDIRLNDKLFFTLFADTINLGDLVFDAPIHPRLQNHAYLN